ncbi:hypothetical protein GOP47_0002207 [Adiantum capillus-veneris]|uniref:PRA1 family protein n=1 Tax=Adiantum capillus-veneris TaxID=13818 RepID=A0A9D4ZNZ9_ADICA|nr:hypothetical protein GOP47_0002207 [Adiantum capillus-veneris]
MVSQGVSSNGKPASTTPTSHGSGARAVIHQVAERTQAVMSRQRPWSELMDRKAFNKPESFADAMSRVLKNIMYFRVNYIIFMLVVIGLSLLWHPVSLVVLAVLVAAWIYLYFGRTEPLVVFNRACSENQVLIVLAIATIVGLFLTKAGSTLTSAIVIGLVVVLVHASFRRPDDLFLDEQENLASGYARIPPSTHV